MNVTWALAGAAVGAITGNQLRRSVFRLSVDRQDAPRTGCPQCGTMLRSLPLPSPRGRCRRCGARIGPRAAILELATAVSLAFLGGGIGPRPELVGFAWLAAVGVALAAIDLKVYRLPDRLTYPAFVVVLASFAGGAVTGTDPASLQRAAFGALVLGGSYLLLAVIQPGQLGLGDVKLAALLGLALGWVSWPVLMFGGCLAFIVSAMVSLVLIALRRISLKSALPFGPFMLAGAAVALIV